MEHIKKLLSNINNVILWTKKWHFFHIVIVIPSILTILSLLITIIKTNKDNDIVAFVYDIGSFFIYTFFAIFALIVQIIFSTINHIRHTPPTLKNKFLLNNKIYNGIYYASSIYTITYLFFLIYYLILCFIN